MNRIIRTVLCAAVGLVLLVGRPAWGQTKGSIVAWGRNSFGECNVPSPNEGFVAVTAGVWYSLGVKFDGSIVAWGRNSFGECNVPSPNAGFVGVAAENTHSLALKSDGSIVAWERNNSGQCNVPSPNEGFVAVAAGGYHSLGLKSDGSIAAWGANSHGECNVPSPNEGFVAVAAGGYHSLGLKSDGSIATWGANSHGECNVPSPNEGFVAVAAGGYHSLGLKSDGSIAAWGWNEYGQCSVASPNAGFVAVAAGSGHSLGLKSDGSIIAWGWNNHGQCNVPSPNTGFVALEAGGNHSLGLKGQAPDTSTDVSLATSLEPYATSGISHAEGAFGIPPLYTPGGVNPTHAGNIIYGNAVETRAGWESTTTWDPVTGGNQPVTDHIRHFATSEVVLGQRSQLGFVAGTQLRLFGYEAFGYEERVRNLTTFSEGQFVVNDWQGAGLVPVRAKVEYCLDVDAAAFEKDAAFVINFVTSMAQGGGEAIAKGSRKALIKVVGKTILKKVVGFISQTGLNPIAAVSSAKTDTKLDLEVRQAAALVSSMDVSNIFTFDKMAREQHMGWYESSKVVQIDPSKPVDFRLALSTSVACSGASDAYAGVTDYRVSFDVDGASDVPLVFEFNDPAPEVGSRYKRYLMAAANTPDLTAGGVSVTGTWGAFASQTDDSLIVLTNDTVSGFLLPLELASTDKHIALSLGAAVSSQGRASDARLQVSYVYLSNGDEIVVDLLDVGLGDVFSFSQQSGIAGMPFASEWTTLTLDVANLSGIQGNLLVAFGNAVTTDVQAGLVIDWIAPDPEAISTPGGDNGGSDDGGAGGNDDGDSTRSRCGAAGADNFPVLGMILLLGLTVARFGRRRWQ